MCSAKIYDYIDDKVLEEIINVLNNDGLIIFPTDTVYGIACNSFSDKAINRLFKAKNRSFNKPIGVLTDSVSKIEMISNQINSYEKELIDKYFPGNLTIILDKKENVSNILTSGKQTIGVRIPNNEIALKILKSYPYPLATTSVNLSGCKEGTEVKDFINEFKNKVEIIIDGGKSKEIPSTIVRIIDNELNVIRGGDLMKNISLYIPNIEDYWYEKKIQSDPLTMSYNAGYDVSYYGYDYDTGCIDFPKKRWQEIYDRRLKDKKYFAYIKDNDLNEFVGYVNYQYNNKDNRYECGILIESIYRGKGYSKTALKLLCDAAKNNGIKELYDNFEIDRGNTLDIFKDIGFRVVKEQTWKKFNKDVKGVLVKIEL